MSYVSVDHKYIFTPSTLFEKLWDLPETWVEPPNYRRGGFSGVIRTTIDGQAAYIKKQVNHNYHSLRHPLGQPTAFREYQAMTIANKLGVDTPVPLFCESEWVGGEHRTLLVTKALEGYTSLSDIPWPMEPAENLAVLRAVAQTLAKLHCARWQHSSLYPTHIFVKKEQSSWRVALLDLEKMRRRLTVKQASHHDLKQFLRRIRRWNDVHRRQFRDAYEYELFGCE